MDARCMARCQAHSNFRDADALPGHTPKPESEFKIQTSAACGLLKNIVFYKEKE